MNLSYPFGQNYTVHIVPIQKLRKEWNVEIPNFQRTYSEKRVEFFFEQLIEEFEQRSDILCLGTLNIVKLQDKYYILDGQHRYLAYCRLEEEYDLEEFTNFRVLVLIRDATSETEMIHYFRQLNTHYVSPEFQENIMSDTTLSTSTMLKEYIQTNHASFISHAEKPKYPNVNLDSFVSFVLKRFPEKTMELFIKENEYMRNHLQIYETQKYHKITQKGTLYYVHVYHSSRASNTERQTIPSSLRRQVWENHCNSTETLTSECYVCRYKITYHDFECGHILAVANGGRNTLENLRCICRACNSNMGTRSLEDFKNEFFL